MEALREKMEGALEARRNNRSLRSLRPGLSGIDFCSNDYLGLARDARIRDAVARSLQREEPLGATGSRLISGNSVAHEMLEADLARYHEAPAALLFNSGYSANTGLLSSVADRHDTILYDQLAHASIRDGLRLSRARSYGFAHNDLNELERKLQRAAGQIFIVLESIYSMDGDEAPLRAMVELAEAYGAALIVDEAHATGVIGPRGAGLVVAEGLAERVWARIHTFGKAVGGHGAVVLGPDYLRSYLLNFSRPFIYTTALPPHHLSGIREAYRIIGEGRLSGELKNKIDYFRNHLTDDLREHFIPSRSAIQSVIWPGNAEVKALAAGLNEAGFALYPVLHPTVPRGRERLRICLHTYNREEAILELIQLLGQRINAYV